MYFDIPQWCVYYVGVLLLADGSPKLERLRLRRCNELTDKSLQLLAHGVLPRLRRVTVQSLQFSGAGLRAARAVAAVQPDQRRLAEFPADSPLLPEERDVTPLPTVDDWSRAPRRLQSVIDDIPMIFRLSIVDLPLSMIY